MGRIMASPGPAGTRFRGAQPVESDLAYASRRHKQP